MKGLGRENIERGLRQLGLGTGAVVEVHSSLGSFGYVQGGAVTVVDALMRVVGKEGAIVMSNYPLSRPLPVSSAERARGIAWKVRRLTDGSEERTSTGAVSDEFRKRDDVVCGTGVHRVCAWGRNAELHSAGYRHLIDVDGWVLLIGVGIDRCSSLHLGERVPIPRDVRQRIEQIQNLPQNVEHIQKEYPPEIIIGLRGPPGDPWGLVLEDADRRGLTRRAKIGAASCLLFKDRALVTIYEDLRRNDPYRLFGLPLSKPDYIE